MTEILLKMALNTITLTIFSDSTPRFTNLPATVSFLDTKSPVTYRNLYILTSTDDNKNDIDLTESMTTKNTKFILDKRRMYTFFKYFLTN